MRKEIKSKLDCLVLGSHRIFLLLQNDKTLKGFPYFLNQRISRLCQAARAVRQQLNAGDPGWSKLKDHETAVKLTCRRTAQWSDDGQKQNLCQKPQPSYPAFLPPPALNLYCGNAGVQM